MSDKTKTVYIEFWRLLSTNVEEQILPDMATEFIELLKDNDESFDANSLKGEDEYLDDVIKGESIVPEKHINKIVIDYSKKSRYADDEEDTYSDDE